MNKPKAELLEVNPAQCVPAPWFNRADLNLTPEFLNDIETNGVRQTLLVRPTSITRFVVEPGRQSGKEGWFWIDRASQNSTGAYDRMEFFKTEDEALTNVPRYEVIAGCRRHGAALACKLDTVPVRVEALTDQQARTARLSENLQRENLTALDEARQLQDLLDTGDYGTGRKAIEALAALPEIGKSVSHVYSRLRLLQLGAAVTAAMKAGKIQATIAELIATLPGEALQEKALKKVLENGPYAYDEDDEFEPPVEKGKGKQAKRDYKAEQEARDERSREPMSFRQVKSMLNSDFRLDLKDNARWPLDDAKLLPAAGPCSTCPKRSGTIPGAFPEIKNPNLCTDPDCFAQKRALCDAATLKAHTDKGHKVLTPEEHKKAFGGNYGVGGGWCQSDEYIGNLKGKDRWESRKASELLGKSMPAPTYGVDQEGKIRPLYRKKEILEIAREKGLLKAEDKPESATPPKAETPEAKAKREAAEAKAKLEEKIERTVNRETANAVLDPIAKGQGFGTWLAPLCRHLFERLDNSDFVNHDLVMERHEWTSGHVVDKVKTLTGFEALAAVVQSFLLDDPSYDTEYDPDLVTKLAMVLGVKLDRKAIEKRVRAELESGAKAESIKVPGKAAEQTEFPAVKEVLVEEKKAATKPAKTKAKKAKRTPTAGAKVKSLAKK